MTRPDAQPSHEVVFDAPWQAQAFALVVSLAETGIFSWAEWTAALSERISRDGALSDDASDYYRHWLAALEGLLQAKDIALPDDVDRLAAAWERAAHATPHGHPIELANDPEHAPVS